MPRILLACVMIVALTMSGCKISGSKASNSQANIRVLNVTADAVSVSMTVDSNATPTPAPTFTNLGYLAKPTYYSVDSGTPHLFTVQSSAPAATFANSSYTLSANTNYTLIIYGSSTSPNSLLIADTTVNSPNSGQFEIRPVHTALASGALDFYLVPAPATGDINSVAANFTSFSLTGVPLFLQYNSGSYVLYVTAAGSKSILYKSQPITFNTNDVVTADIYSTGSGSLVNVALTKQNDSSNDPIPAPSLQSQVKFVNALPSAASIGVQVDGSLVFTPVGYATATVYTLEPAGSRAINVYNNSGGASVANLTKTLPAASDSSVVVIPNSAANPPTAGTLLLLPPDNNLPPPANSANVRFVNASTAGSLDIQWGSKPAASALAGSAASPYVAELPVGTPGITVTANVTGNGATVLTMSGVQVTTGKTYTIYVVGPAGSLQGVLTQDN